MDIFCIINLKKPEQNLIDVPSPANTEIELKRDILKCILKFLSNICIHMVVENYRKDLKESVYHRTVVSALAVGFTMIGKSLMKMSPPPSLGKFDVEDGVKFVAIILGGGGNLHMS